jgi:hypothetical protein
MIVSPSARPSRSVTPRVPGGRHRQEYLAIILAVSAISVYLSRTMATPIRRCARTTPQRQAAATWAMFRRERAA